MNVFIIQINYRTVFIIQINYNTNKLIVSFVFILYFNPHLRVCVLILDRRKEREKGTSFWERTLLVAFFM